MRADCARSLTLFMILLLPAASVAMGGYGMAAERRDTDLQSR
jgi:hypothetical protein